MLRINVKHDSTGIRSISAAGHTGFAESGSDIVCAAISTLMQALWIGLEDVLEIGDLTVESAPEVPLMRISWKSEDETLQAIARTVYIALCEIAREYPDYVEIDETTDETQGG